MSTVCNVEIYKIYTEFRQCGSPASEAGVTRCDNATSYDVRKNAFHHLYNGLNGEASLLSLISHVAFDIVSHSMTNTSSSLHYSPARRQAVDRIILKHNIPTQK